MSKKDEERRDRNPYVHLEKSTVLQEARNFNAVPINKRKCIITLTKILSLIYQGENFQSREATDTFFAMTKLFQEKNVPLRRMVYLCIKAFSTISDDVMMVTSSLTKDITGKNEGFKGPAIRTLCTITDKSTIQSVERLLKQAIVSKNISVSSSALVSSLHLLTKGQDVVRRWVNEVTQAHANSHHMAQYHALGLLYHIKQKDKLGVQKLVTTQMRKSGSRSPYAHCLLIRYASNVLDDNDDNDDLQQSIFSFLDNSLRNKNEMVVYEAARAIVNIRGVSSRQIAPAVSVLQLFLSSPRPVLRFAAVKTLNKLSISHPNALKSCVLDMEQLITDSNRSVATLAITTLLKTGTESSVDRLMKQISSFMHEITDEFKIVVVDAIKALCLKFPQKYPVLMNFLSTNLRDEGGYEYKKAIVRTMGSIVENIVEAKEAALHHLCEYIEDCEFPSLLTTILNLLGSQGPTTSHPNHYIRFIYNRLILENPLVRAAAVEALQKFGQQCHSLRDSIIVLFNRCLLDTDDEVRDRIIYALESLRAGAAAEIDNRPTLDIGALERSLNAYLQQEESFDTAFSVDAIPVEQEVVEEEEDEDIKQLAQSVRNRNVDVREETEKRLHAVEELSEMGVLFKSSKTVNLTESETEYVVKATKHMFAEYIVFEFTVKNTLQDQVLEKVQVMMEGGSQEIDEDDIVLIAAEKIACDEVGYSYIAFPHDCSEGTQEFEARLDFHVRDFDPDTEELDSESYEDTYSLENVTLALSDYILPAAKPNFAAAWAALESNAEMEDTFAMENWDSIETGVKELIKFFGMAPCEKSNLVADDSTTHSLFLSGVFVGGFPFLIQARFALSDSVSMELSVRSENEDVSQLIIDSL
eukprot:m.8955 g.8955  ORF g.8955 m.8955 type:complete len:868 (+) comp6252_c0_seq1:77-2680(+)